MSRKKTADKPVSSASEASNTTQNTASKQTRAPGSSSNAVTHKHKKAAMPTLAEAAVEIGVAIGTVKAAITKTRTPTHDEIAIRAYLIAESRGFQSGSQDDDWLTAERELIAAR